MVMIRTEELDRRFDEGEDISRHLDHSGARRPNRKRVREDDDAEEGSS